MNLYRMEPDAGGRRGWRHYAKMCALYLVLVIGAFVLYFIASYALQMYQIQKGTERVDLLAKSLQQQEEKAYNEAMADTYGGKTPQETLQLYIAAVEQGNYELASRYFIKKKQAEELKSFNGASSEDIKKYLDLVSGSLKERGAYDQQRTYFSVSRPISVRMQLYPNGVWKIVGI